MQLLSWRQNRWRHAKHLKTWQYRPQPITSQCEQGRGPIRDGVTGATCKTAWLLTKTWHSLPACLGSFLWWKLGVSHFTESRTPSHWIETSWSSHGGWFFIFSIRSLFTSLSTVEYMKNVQWLLELLNCPLIISIQNNCCKMSVVCSNKYCKTLCSLAALWPTEGVGVRTLLMVQWAKSLV